VKGLEPELRGAGDGTDDLETGQLISKLCITTVLWTCLSALQYIKTDPNALYVLVEIAFSTLYCRRDDIFMTVNFIHTFLANFCIRISNLILA
jgi:hypothetical protein